MGEPKYLVMIVANKNYIRKERECRVYSEEWNILRVIEKR